MATAEIKPGVLFKFRLAGKRHLDVFVPELDDKAYPKLISSQALEGPARGMVLVYDEEEIDDV